MARGDIIRTRTFIKYDIGTIAVMTTAVLREQLTADSALFHFFTFLSPPTSTQTMFLFCGVAYN